MLTVDDCNTIIEKYGDTGFWYRIDFSKFDISSISLNETMSFTYDSFPVTFKLDEDYLRVNCYIDKNIYATNIAYMERHDGTINVNVNHYEDRILILTTKSTVVTNPFILYIYVTSNPVPIEQSQLPALNDTLFIPLSSLQIPVVNGEFDDKFYIKQLGTTNVSYMIDGEDVSYSEDETGRYLTLPSANDCTIGVKSNISSIDVYNVTFHEFKTLPLLNIPTLYRGTPQKITLINSDTEEEITEFQAYYNGRLLKDNIITIPEGTGNVADITVDLKDPNYPYSTVKLKVNVSTYTCRNQSDVETAISEGIKYIRLHYAQDDINLDGVEFNDMTIYYSTAGTFRNCIFNNSSIRIGNGNHYDNGGNVFNNCNIYSTPSTPRNLRMSTAGSVFNNCTVNNIWLYNYNLYFTGTITNCRFTRSVIISDGDVTLTNNEFDGIISKDYFPNFLYLTGDYTVTGNTFNLEGEWEELAFNMCIIKTTNDFNPSQFINNNIFNLNITYEDEPTNTFYYNIVDDDKIRAVRL